MNCTELKEALSAEPAVRTPAINAHLASCPECSAFVRELDAFESRLKRALAIPVAPKALPTAAELAAAPAATVTALARPARRFGRPAWFALAATGLIAALLVGALLTVYPRYALAGALVGHVADEPGSWAVTDVAVPDASLAYVLKRAGVALDPGGPRVTYAQSCTFRGWHVPHLVVQTNRGPMTVMPLRHEHVSRIMEIDSGGYRGVIVPAGSGALAVLTHGITDQAAIEAVAAQAVAAVHFIN